MALTNPMESATPQEPERELHDMPGSGAPTLEAAEQYDVPETDTRIQSTTVAEGLQAPDVAPFPPTSTPDRRSRRGLAIGGGVAAVALSAAAFFGLSGSNEDRPNTQEVSAEGSAATNPEPTPTTEFEVRNPWSYTSEFEPVFPYSTDPAEMLQQVRENYHRAAFAETQELRDQYIRFTIGEDNEEYGIVLTHIMKIQGGYTASGMNPDTYLEQNANEYELISSETESDGTLRITYDVINVKDTSDVIRATGVFEKVPASGQYPERYVLHTNLIH